MLWILRAWDIFLCFCCFPVDILLIEGIFALFSLRRKRSCSECWEHSFVPLCFIFFVCIRSDNQIRLTILNFEPLVQNWKKKERVKETNLIVKFGGIN